MRAHKPDKHLALRVLNDDDQPVRIPLNVENDAVIRKDTDTAVDCFDFSGRIPVGLFRFRIACAQRLLSIR